MKTFQVRTGGELLEVAAAPGWVARLLAAATGTAAENGAAIAADMALENGAAAAARLPESPTVTLRADAHRSPFDHGGMSPVTRGAYADGSRVLLENACSSGFDLLLEPTAAVLRVQARYRPDPKTRAANTLLAGRFRLLAAQTLLHYAVLWWGGRRGRVPLHASVVDTAAGVLLLAGPGGVGKTTAIRRALSEGGTATADNLCCADDMHCYGIAEPLRTDPISSRHGPAGPRIGPQNQHGRGRRTSHGRVEVAFPGRVPALAPDRLIVLARGATTATERLDPAEAARSLVSGTYAAGELRRYWAFAATLALGTGMGPAHPPIEAVAAGYARRLPCVRVQVADGDTADIDSVVVRS
jgi:hypothetical protein